MKNALGTAVILVLSIVCVLGSSQQPGDGGINISNECLIPPPEGSKQEIVCALGGNYCKQTGTSVSDGTRLKITCPNGNEKASLCSSGIWKPAPTCSSCGKQFNHQFRQSNSRSELEKFFPWEAMVYRKDKFNKKIDSYIRICGAVLISSKVLLSNAYCFTETGTNRIADLQDYKIGLGKFNWIWDVNENHEVKRNIKTVYIRDDYNINLYSNDVAVIIMSEPVEKTSLTFPACVDWASSLHPQPDEKAIIGRFNMRNSSTFSRMTYIELTLTSLVTCRQNLPQNMWKYLTNDKFCGTMENVDKIIRGGLSSTYFSKEKMFVIGLASLRSKEKSNILILSKISENIDFIAKHIDEKYIE